MSAKLPKPRVRTVESNARDGDAAAGSPLGFRGKKGSRQTQQSNATHNPSPPSSSKSSSSFTHVKKHDKKIPLATRAPYSVLPTQVQSPPLPVSQHTPPLCLISSDGTKTSLVAYLSALHVACLRLLFFFPANKRGSKRQHVK